MRTKTILRELKGLMMVALLSIMSVALVSCSDDDNDAASSVNDYYVQFDFAGGGLSAQQLSQLTADFNSKFQSTFSWNNISSERAIYYHGKAVDVVKEAYSDGLDFIISGTLDITITLKTKEGKAVKKEVVRVSRTGIVS